MWTIPKIGQRVRISTKFWDAFLKYKVSAQVPDWYDRCNKDGGWVVALVNVVFPSCNQIVLGFENPGNKAGTPPNFQVFLDTGAFHSFEDGPPMFELLNISWSSILSCPICGSHGTPMINKFYCINSGCQNYEP